MGSSRAVGENARLQVLPLSGNKQGLILGRERVKGRAESCAGQDGGGVEQGAQCCTGRVLGTVWG